MYEIVADTRGFEMNMAYPQYEYLYSHQPVISVATWIQLQHYVCGRLNDKTFGPNVNVREHMISILNGNVPFGMRITS